MSGKRVIILNPGDRFGRLTIKREVSCKPSYRQFLCHCDCGNEKIVALQNLRSGITVSCGCFHKEAIKRPKEVLQTENYEYRNTRLFSIWQGIKRRCYDPKRKAYKYYGAKGVKMCHEWKTSFLTFRTWALNNGYTDNLTIERENVNKDYCPSNCKWIPWSQQNNNKSSSRRLLCNGVEKIMTEWSKDLGIKLSTIAGRLSKGWSDADALLTPVKKGGQR